MRLILALVASLIFSNLAVGASIEEDVQRYIQIFSGEKYSHSGAADTLAWMGLSDVRLFDIIERRLLEDAAAGRANSNEKNRVARYVRSLGFSGQSKYEPTLAKFAADPVYGRYAKEALDDLRDYSKWNPVISNRSSFVPPLSDDANRVLNMLRSNDLLLQRVGAKRVYFGTHDDSVFELLAQQLRTSYVRTDLNDRERGDSVAWMAKALGTSKNAKYIALLDEVAANCKSQVVVRHAKDALVKNYGRPRSG